MNQKNLLKCGCGCESESVDESVKDEPEEDNGCCGEELLKNH